MTKLKAQLLEEEKSRRAVKRGPKPVGKLQHAATASGTQAGADGAPTSAAAATPSAQSSIEADALLAAQIDAALGTEEGDLASIQGVGILEDRLRQGQERGQTIQEVIQGLEDDVEVEGGDGGGATWFPLCGLEPSARVPCTLRRQRRAAWSLCL